MRKTLAILTVICVGSAFIGCSKQAPKPGPISNKKANPENQNAVIWNLRLDSTCGEWVEEGQCIAKYGFTIQLTDGQYKIGPGPSGEVRSGKIAEEELSSLKLALGDNMSATGVSAESHATIEAAEAEDAVSIAQEGGVAETLAKTTGTDLTYKTQSADQAQGLIKAMRALAEKYYQLPFPDTCLDQVESVRSLFASVQTCSTNADCSYVDIDFNPLDLAAASYVTTDDCKLVRPLVVANANLLKSSQEKLMDSYNRLSSSCESRIYRDNCTANGFEPNGAAPTCEQGRCKAGSAPSSLR
jgi:hypothetical protein